MDHFYSEFNSNFIEKLIHNLPFYLTISYLFSRYILLFLATLTDRKQSAVAQESKNNLIEILKFKRIKSKDEAKDTDLITGEYFLIKNHNYKYIENLFKRNEPTNKSFLLNLFEENIYKVKPHLKFSRQFINTYAVAFMIIYFFTIFGFRFSDLLNDLLVKFVELSSQYVYGISEHVKLNKHNFNLELKITCVISSLLIIIEMFESIKHFQLDLLQLHKGNGQFYKLLNHYNYNSYRKMIKTRNETGRLVTQDSIHFSGYLIAHLVYGYLIMFSSVLLVILLFKFVYYYPNVAYNLSQFILPVVTLLILKSCILEFITKTIFKQRNTYRVESSTIYHIMSFFNFFFDCFLGILSCFSRVWLTNFISFISLTRIDNSIFNTNNDFIIRRLDKGYLAYSNFVRMEHWYNNPVVNGFCEQLIESMLNSQIYRKKFEDKASKEDVSKVSLKSTKNSAIFNAMLKKSNPNFQYSSFLRLRNLFYLCVMLRKYEKLRQHRYYSIRDKITVEQIRGETLLETVKKRSFYNMFTRYGKHKSNIEVEKNINQNVSRMTRSTANY